MAERTPLIGGILHFLHFGLGRILLHFGLGGIGAGGSFVYGLLCMNFNDVQNIMPLNTVVAKYKYKIYPPPPPPCYAPFSKTSLTFIEETWVRIRGGEISCLSPGCN